MEILSTIVNILPTVSPKLFGEIAGVLELVGNIPYCIAIIQRKTIPSWATWWIWTLSSIILAGSYYASGARETMWQPIGAVGWNLLVAILAIYYGTRQVTRLDIVCCIGALCSMGIWYITGNPIIALVSIIGVSFLGTLPTLYKAYLHPKSEDLTSWGIWWLCDVANVLAIMHWSFAIAVYPVYLLASVSILIGVIAVRRYIFATKTPQILT